MTSKPISLTPPVSPVGQFPEYPPRDNMQNPIHLHDPGYQAALRRHFGASDTTIVMGEVPVARTASQRQGVGNCSRFRAYPKNKTWAKLGE